MISPLASPGLCDVGVMLRFPFVLSQADFLYGRDEKGRGKSAPLGSRVKVVGNFPGYAVRKFLGLGKIGDNWAEENTQRAKRLRGIQEKNN